MAKFPRFSSTTVARGSGQVRATDLGALTRSSDQALYSGLGAFGRGLGVASDYAFKATMARQALDDEIEIGRATQKINDVLIEKGNEAKAYDATQDMPDPDSPDYLKVLTTMNKDIRDGLTQEAQRDFLEKVNDIYGSIQSPRVKAKILNWVQDNVGKWSNGIRSEYAEKLDDYQSSELENMAFLAAKGGDLETANYYIDLMDKYELRTREKTLDLKQAVLLQRAESDARDAIQLARLEGKGITQALAEGYKTIDSYREKVTKLSDIQSLTSRIEREFTIMLTGEFLRNEQQKSNVKKEAIELIRKPETTAAQIDSKVGNLDDEESAKIKKAQIERARKGPPTTDTKAFNRIFGDFVDSLENPDIDAISMLDDGYLERKYSDNDYDSLKEWFAKEYPMSIVPSIKDAVEHGKRRIPTLKSLPMAGMPGRTFGVKRPLDDKRIALYNRAFMSWLSSQEKPTTDDIMAESRVLANIYKNMPDDKVRRGGQVDSMVKPETKAEFDDALDSLSNEGRQRYWQKWYKHAKSQGWLKKK